jgi:type VI secretion system protein ImpC
VFDELRSLRDRLDKPSTFESAARELLGEAQPKPQPRASGGSLLEEMLEDVEGPAPAGTPPMQFAPARDELREQIRRIVMPHVVPNDDPRKMELSDKVEQAATELMREILHDPAFQAMEATWRALHFLVQRLETGSRLMVRVFDITRAELAADLESENGTLQRLLVEQPRDNGAPWSVIVGDYSFAPSADDIALLNRVAALARRAGAPFVAAGDPQIAGAPGFDREPDPAEWTRADAPEWSQLRSSSDAKYIGLVAPRFLSRMPYGEDADETDAISFEEMSAPPRHGDYLWANGAYAAALLLAQSYADEDAGGRGQLAQNIGGLPLHLYKHDGFTEAKPCAESVMTERAANRLAQAGLMPLASLRDSGEVRLVRFQSIAQPSARLAGF